MQAFQLVSAHTTELREVAVPEPGPGEVLVKVGASGACHSDLHLVHAPAEAMAAFPLPFTLGHENAGWVEATGPGVEGWERTSPWRSTESSVAGAVARAWRAATTNAAPCRQAGSDWVATAGWPHT